jgi:dTDP-4-amino-4,6-dideoxygalactose transaminase
LNNIVNDKISLPKLSTPALTAKNHVWHLFVVRIKNTNRQELINYLIENRIGTQIHYPIPVFSQEAYTEYNDLTFRITRKLSNEIFSLPISSTIDRRDVKKVCKAINNYTIK